MEPIEHHTTSNNAKRKKGDLNIIEFDASGSGYAARILEADWKSHRAFIEESHSAGKSRAEIRDALSHRGLNVSLAQLYPRMRKWNLKVYNDRKIVKTEAHEALASDLCVQDQSTTDLPLEPRQLSDAEAILMPSQADALGKTFVGTRGSLSSDEVCHSLGFDILNGDYRSESSQCPEQDLESLTRPDIPINIKTPMEWAIYIVDTFEADPNLSHAFCLDVYMLVGFFFQFCSWPDATLLMWEVLLGRIRSMIAEIEFGSFLSLELHAWLVHWIVLTSNLLMEPSATELGALSNLKADLQYLADLDIDSKRTLRSYLSRMTLEDAVRCLESAELRMLGCPSSGRTALYISGANSGTFSGANDRSSRGIGKIGAHVHKYLPYLFSGRISRAQRSNIRDEWNADVRIVSQLLPWCSEIVQQLRKDGMLETNQVDNTSVNHPESLFLELLIYLLKRLFGFRIFNSQHCPRNAEYSPGIPNLDRLCCMLAHMEVLAVITLLAVSNATSVDLQAAKSVLFPRSYPTVGQDMSQAFDNLRTMRSAELRLLYFESCWVIFNDQPGPAYDTFTHESIAGIFAYTLTDHLCSMSEKTYSIPSLIGHIEEHGKPAGRTSKFKIEVDRSSVVSSCRSSMSSMRRIKRQAISLKPNLSANSLMSLVLRNFSSASIHSSRILSDALSLLSFKSDSNNMVSSKTSIASSSTSTVHAMDLD